MKDKRKIFEVKISDINIGERFRYDMGDLDSLALSIQIEGQLEPIILSLGENGKYNLVNGERRLRAHQRLGKRTVDAILMDNMGEAKRQELELITCIQSKKLLFIEEALAVKKIVDRRRRETKGLVNIGQSLRDKDIALELNLTSVRMSENLKIARAIEEHPEVEAWDCGRTEFLRRIRNKEYRVFKGGVGEQKLKENLIVDTALGCLDKITDKIIDFAILDYTNPMLLEEALAKLKPLGQMVVFCEFTDIQNVQSWAKENKLNVSENPFVWNIVDKSTYKTFLWIGKNLLSTIRPLPSMLSAKQDPKTLHAKARPMKLMSQLVRSCTERGYFVVVPECWDIETVLVCQDLERNIRAACPSKEFRDKLILSVSGNEEQMTTRE